ncbi:MAG: glucosyltransferase domain-containing protein [Candidatus Limiplasma sp.]|nr:glucosyltransferase domain-containing protein [Candidatus Limiplasma sp.]
MQQYLKDLKRYIEHKWYILFVVFIALLSYGYSTVHMHVGVDSLHGDLYMGDGNGLLTAGRFGMLFWEKVFFWTTGTLTPISYFASDLIAVVLLLLAATSFCILFDRCTNRRFSMWVNILFVGLLISYPLMNEIWSYLACNRWVCGSMLFTAFALLLVWDALHRKSKPWVAYPIAAVLMTIVVSGYESVTVVYVFLVFALLLLQALYGQPGEDHIKTILLQGLVYAAILIAAVLLRLVVHQILLAVNHLSFQSNGAVQIHWFEDSISSNAAFLLLSILYNYILTALIYFPIAELVVAVIVLIVFAIVMVRKKPSILLPVLGMLFSLIVLSVIQGSATPYRACQVFGIFIAFTAALLADLLMRQKRIAVRMLSIGLGLLLCVNQGVLLSYYMSADSLRSEREVEQIQTIAKDVLRNQDTTKPVVLLMLSEIPYTTGKLYPWLNNQITLPEDSQAMSLFIKINEKIRDTFHYTRRVNNVEATRKPVDTNLVSVLYWAQSTMAENLDQVFSYCGYDLHFSDDPALVELCKTYAKANDMPSYPHSGYVVESKNCIIVRVN